MGRKNLEMKGKTPVGRAELGGGVGEGEGKGGGCGRRPHFPSHIGGIVLIILYKKKFVHYVKYEGCNYAPSK